MSADFHSHTAKSFLVFGETARDEAPLYAALSERIAQDPEILSLTTNRRSGQPPPNLLFAAVHFLLLGGVSHPLNDFYPSVSGSEGPDGDAYTHFRSFCLGHRREIEQLTSSSLVQSNIVERCAYLYPTFGLISEMAGGKPLALVEVGAAAGLNLNWALYAYDYGDSGQHGSLDSAVEIASEFRGNRRPALPPSAPSVVLKIGLDLNPIDLSDELAVRWLKALVWPEDTDRLLRLGHAIELAGQHKPQLVTGDALDTLQPALDRVPLEAALCVFNTHTLYQMSPDRVRDLTAILAKHGRTQDVYHVSAEWRHGQESALMELTIYRGVDKRVEQLAECDAHGRWIKWLGAAALARQEAPS